MIITLKYLFLNVQKFHLNHQSKLLNIYEFL